MNLVERLHALHRAWRYRLRSEKQEIGFLLGRDLRGKTVVDIGAHRGAYTYWMHKKAGSRGRVVAFEPQPELFQYITEMKAAFHLRNLIVVPYGLSDQPGQATLYRPKHHWGGASLELDPKQDSDRLPIEITTLDNYFVGGELRPVSFIKCDVEGLEYEVFRGGRRILAEDRPELLFEHLEPKAREGKLFAYLAELGYRGFFFVGRRLLPLEQYESLRPTLPGPAKNYVFLPAEAAKP
jgi:FkbM family methyltransferase